MGIEMVECEDEALYGKEYLSWKKHTLGAQVGEVCLDINGLHALHKLGYSKNLGRGYKHSLHYIPEHCVTLTTYNPLDLVQTNCVLHSFPLMCHNLMVKVARVVQINKYSPKRPKKA